MTLPVGTFFTSGKGDVWRVEWIYPTANMLKLKNLETSEVLLADIGKLGGFVKLVEATAS